MGLPITLHKASGSMSGMIVLFELTTDEFTTLQKLSEKLDIEIPLLIAVLLSDTLQKELDEVDEAEAEAAEH